MRITDIQNRWITFILVVVLGLSSSCATLAESYFDRLYVWRDSITYLELDESTVALDSLFYGGNLPDSGELEFPAQMDGKDVVRILDHAFQKDEGMIRVTIPYSVQVIEDGAFNAAPHLNVVIMEEGVQSIGKAFCQCPQLAQVRLPSTISEIAEGAFTDNGPFFHLVVYRGSYAEKYARENSIPYMLENKLGKELKLEPGNVIRYGELNGSSVEWYVLQVKDNEALILSRDILGEKKYSSTSAPLWYNSEIHSYLNDELIYELFSTEEGGLISTHKIYDPASPYSLSGLPGLSSYDSMFLLSYFEARDLIPTDEIRSASTDWWLRTSRDYENYTHYVSAEGELREGVEIAEELGIRPALWICLENASGIVEVVNGTKWTVKQEEEDNGILETGDIIQFGSYEQDNDFSNGYEELDWLVLEINGTTAKLITKYCIDVQPYHSSDSAVNWGQTSLRGWLNEEFIDSAFTIEEQNKLIQTAVENFDADAAANTYQYSVFIDPIVSNDLVWILENNEVNRYLPELESKLAYVTKYADAKGAASNNEGYGNWLLRTDKNPEGRANIMLPYEGAASVVVTRSDTTVRPVIQVDLVKMGIMEPLTEDGSIGNGESEMVQDSPYEFASRHAPEGLTHGISGYFGAETSIILPSYNLDEELLSWISDDAFNGNLQLYEVIIPEEYTKIGDNAFAYCLNLSSISIPDTMTTIGDYAFSNCTGLERIFIPDSVVDIGEHAFEGSGCRTIVGSKGSYAERYAMIYGFNFEFAEAAEMDGHAAETPETVYTIGSTMEFGVFEQDGNAENGKESIQWRILDVQDGKVLLLAEQVLTIDYFIDLDVSGRGWVDSNPRKWLNGEFMEEAFSNSELASMTKTQRLKGNYRNEYTEDYVFLLSAEEAERYFIIREDRRAGASSAAASLASYIVQSDGYAYWWLTSDRSGDCAYITNEGFIGDYNVNPHGIFGLRPAMWIHLPDGVGIAQTEDNTSEILSLPDAVKVGEMVSFGRYEQDADATNGPESISWRVLSVDESGEAILISNDILEHGVFETSSYDETPWENSEMYQWLNEEFYNQAFSQAEQEKMLPFLDDLELEIGKVSLLTVSQLEVFLPQVQDRAANITTFVEKQYYVYEEPDTDWWVRNDDDPVSLGQGRHVLGTNGQVEKTMHDYNNGIRPVIQLRFTGDSSAADEIIPEHKDVIDTGVTIPEDSEEIIVQPTEEPQNIVEQIIEKNVYNKIEDNSNDEAGNGGKTNELYKQANSVLNTGEWPTPAGSKFMKNYELDFGDDIAIRILPDGSIEATVEEYDQAEWERFKDEGSSWATQYTDEEYRAIIDSYASMDSFQEMQTKGKYISVSCNCYGTLAGVTEDGKIAFNTRSEKRYWVEESDSKWQNLTDVALGGYSVIALKQDGTIVWEDNYGSFENGTHPSEWMDIVAIDNDQIAVGLRKDGTVYYSTNNSLPWYPDEYILLDEISSWTDIVQVDTSWDSVVGLKADGTVVAAGDNHLGKMDVSSWKDIKKVAVGLNYVVGLKKDGTIVSTITNNPDLLGMYSCISLQNVVDVYANRNYILAILIDGSVHLLDPAIYANSRGDGARAAEEWNFAGMVSAQ